MAQNSAPLKELSPYSDRQTMLQLRANALLFHLFKEKKKSFKACWTKVSPLGSFLLKQSFYFYINIEKLNNGCFTHTVLLIVFPV
jgi:hypothetical protein